MSFIVRRRVSSRAVEHETRVRVSLFDKILEGAFGEIFEEDIVARSLSGSLYDVLIR
jgi:hypothetical protein